MSDVAQGSGDATAPSRPKRGAQVALLLECFSGPGAAGKSRHALNEQLTTRGDAVLDSVVLQVDAKHRASVHDPRRVVQGTLTALLTWGLFGLVAGGLASMVIWAVLGAICGGLWAYSTEHLLRKDELLRVGARLPAASSVLFSVARTTDARGLLTAAATRGPTTASVVAVDDQLGTRAFVGATDPVEVPTRSDSSAMVSGPDAPTSMVVVRYPDAGTAKDVAARAAPTSKKATSPVQVELVIRVDPNGRRHVADPSVGVKAWAKSDLVSWGLFGVLVGAIAGATGGGGLTGSVDDAVVTGVGWAVFGLLAGALYGLWAGRAVSARRLRGLQGLLTPDSSLLVAWTDGPVRPDALTNLSRPGSQRLVLHFNPVEGGAVLEAA